MRKHGEQGKRQNSSSLNLAIKMSFCFFLLCLVLPFNSSSYAETFSASLIDVDGSPIGTRTPLILVHGIHGKPGSTYWQNFVFYFNSSGLTSKYKLYNFDYDSDIETVSSIGQYLANEVNTKLPNNNIVILAHSMGGLVSRSYLQEHGGNGKIIKIITLATPHEGTPAENDVRELIFTDNAWCGIFAESQWLLHARDWVTDGENGPLLDSTAPNRSDLRWDNFDTSILKSSNDVNIWLHNLNYDTTYDSQIIAYCGYINPLSTIRILWETSASVTASLLPAMVPPIDINDKLIYASAIMDAGLNYNFSWNDGVVPYESSSFARHPHILKRPFFDYGHFQMRDGNSQYGTKLFDTINADLTAIYGQTNNSTAGAGITLAGNIAIPGQVNQYPFTVTTPGKYVIYTRDTTSTYGSLYDSNHNSLANSSSGGELNNFRIEFTIAVPGTYYVDVAGLFSSITGSYELHIEWPGHGTVSDDHGSSAWSATPVCVGSVTSGVLDVNGDKDFFSFTVMTPGKYVIYTRGTTSTYGSLYDSNYSNLANSSTGGELNNFRIEYTITAPGTYYVQVAGLFSSITGSYNIHIDGPGAGSTTDIGDHGASAWNASPVSVGSVTSGVLDVNGDRDFFSFVAGTPGKYVIYTQGTTSTYGSLYDSNYNNLANSSAGGELNNFRIEYTITAPGTYYVQVAGLFSSITGSYDLHIDGPSGISLTGLTINGASSVTGDSTTAYTATASWSNGTNTTLVPSWSENSAYASISSGGVLRTSTVTTNQPVTIAATFTSGGIAASASKAVTITVPPITNYPNLTPYQPSDWLDKIVVSNSLGSNILFKPTDSLYVDWAMMNNGTGPVLNSFYTDLYVDGNLNHSWYITSLPPNYYTYLTGFSIGALSAGTHTLKIVVDSSDSVSESNETDNQFTKTITVGLTCSDIPAKIVGTYYSTIMQAYNDAETGDILQIEGMTLKESPNFNKDISVSLKGGYDCNYSANTLTTVFTGALTISSGTVSIENILIQ